MTQIRTTVSLHALVRKSFKDRQVHSVQRQSKRLDVTSETSVTGSEGKRCAYEYSLLRFYYSFFPKEICFH